MKEQITTLGSSGAITEPILLASGFNFSIRGDWAGTIKLQRSFDQGDSWGDVKSYTASIEDTGTEPEGALYRAIFSTYTSGSAWVRFGQ